MAKPRIAIIMDENTSDDSSRYEVGKGYFEAIHRAGGLPFGIPYLPEIVETVIDEFDGFLSVGGRINFPTEWYVDGDRSQFPLSDRLAVDRALMSGFLDRDKPVLGICNGMQMLACLHGCRMVSDIRALRPDILQHDARNALHPATIREGTALRAILGVSDCEVNTRHREAVVELSATVVGSAYAPDGTIEAIEIPGRRFAIGLQWHPEAFATSEHPGNRIFGAFVAAARAV